MTALAMYAAHVGGNAFPMRRPAADWLWNGSGWLSGRPCSLAKSRAVSIVALLMSAEFASHSRSFFPGLPRHFVVMHGH